MVCPRSGEAILFEFSHNDTEVFQCFLDEANKANRSERPRQVLIMGNASWHKNKSLKWGRFEPLYLPPYSPDMNPIERLWLVIKAEWFKDYVCKTREELVERLCKALCWAIERTEGNIQTCRIRQVIQENRIDKALSEREALAIRKRSHFVSRFVSSWWMEIIKLSTQSRGRFLNISSIPSGVRFSSIRQTTSPFCVSLRISI